MRYQIRLCINYDTESGKAEVTQVAVSTGESPFAAAVQEVKSQPVDNTPAAERPRQLSKARHLAELLRIDSAQIEEVARTRPVGRIVEVLEWIHRKKQTESIRNPTGMFHSLVARD